MAVNFGWAQSVEHVQAQLMTPHGFYPGRNSMVEIEMRHAPGWHTYGPAELGATTIDWQLPMGWSAGEILWPNQKNFEIQGISSWGYSDTIKLRVPIFVSSSAKMGEEVEIKANISWIVCGDGMCVPGEKVLAQKVTIGGGGTPMVAVTRAMMSLDWKILLAALVGGLVLNLMPCVFPVLGVKILSFMKQAQADQRQVVTQAVAYAVGIVVSCVALGVALVVLRDSGAAVGWGFQLQDARLVWAVVAVIMILAMNMAGGWTLPALACEAAAHADQKKGVLGALMSGALMVLVATPCSAPFLGLAIGGVFVLPFAQALLVMAVMGVGLALPYVLLAVWPSLIKKLPKPGEWMEDLKKILAWVMAAAALYEAWVYVGQVSPEEALKGLMGLLVLLAGVWAAFHWRKFGRALGVVMVITGLWMGLLQQPAETLTWEAWSSERVTQLRQEGRTVVVDFTARWCVNCLVNERNVWGNPRVQEVVRRNNIALLKADWTKRDARIAAELKRHGTAAVPLVVIYNKNSAGEGLALPNLLSVDEVLRALE